MMNETTHDSTESRAWMVAKLDEGAYESANNLFKHGLKGRVDNAKELGWLAKEYDDVAYEAAVQCARSDTNQEEHSTSLHVLYVEDDTQHPHIHAPVPSQDETTTAKQLDDDHAKRVVFIMTGEEGGEYCWAGLKGGIQLSSIEENGQKIPTANGTAEDKWHRVKIPPYSIAAVDVTGVLHSFKNARCLSYHPRDIPVEGYEEKHGQNALISAIERWVGAVPQGKENFRPLNDKDEVPTIKNAKDFFAFNQQAYNYLKAEVMKGPDNQISPDDLVKGAIDIAHNYSKANPEHAVSHHEGKSNKLIPDTQNLAKT